jgi:hypothetical protein
MRNVQDIRAQISDSHLGDAGDDKFTRSEPFTTKLTAVNEPSRTAEDNLSVGVYSQQTAYLQPYKLQLLHIDN